METCKNFPNINNNKSLIPLIPLITHIPLIPLIPLYPLYPNVPHMNRLSLNTHLGYGVADFGQNLLFQTVGSIC